MGAQGRESPVLGGPLTQMMGGWEPERPRRGAGRSTTTTRLPGRPGARKVPPGLPHVAAAAKVGWLCQG